MTKTQDTLNSYVLKGYVLKQVSETLQDYVDGELDGLAGEVLEDDSVVIYRLRRDDLKVSARPFLTWAEGKVERRSGRSVGVTYERPEGRSQGLFVTKSLKILVPLRV